MIELRFPLRDVLALADHAIAAPDHQPSYSNTLDATTPTAALSLVGDEGLYLMSNGMPNQQHPTENSRLHPVYADGYRTSSSKHAVADAIGGDDFVQPLPLLESQPGEATLHAQLTAAVGDGFDLFVIDLDKTSMQLTLTESRRITR
jgi:hypothetical protein